MLGFLKIESACRKNTKYEITEVNESMHFMLCYAPGVHSFVSTPFLMNQCTLSRHAYLWTIVENNAVIAPSERVSYRRNQNLDLIRRVTCLFSPLVMKSEPLRSVIDRREDGAIVGSWKHVGIEWFTHFTVVWRRRMVELFIQLRVNLPTERRNSQVIVQLSMGADSQVLNNPPLNNS